MQSRQTLVRIFAKSANRKNQSVSHDQYLNAQRPLTVAIPTIYAAASLSGAHTTLHVM
jgi:hypothetical protein